MNLSRRELLAAGAASAASALPALPNTTEQSTQSKRVVPPAAQTLPASNLPIRDYLAREARRITDNALVDVKTPEEFNRRLPQRRRRFMEMMGLSDLPAANARGAVPFESGVVERATYRIEKIHYESLPNLHVTANFYVPKGATASARRPGVLLYAALLDGRVRSVFLESPPATQDVAGQKDGKGPALEMLSCLRYTDLPQIAGLLHPAQIVISGEFPSTYAWAEELYGRLGSADKFRRVKTMSDWA